MTTRILGALLACGLLAACAKGTSSSSTTPATTGAAPPALITGPPPWPTPQPAAPLIAEAGLPILPQEALDEHIHAHLDVFYDGQPVTVPQYIGINLQPVGISPLHTHDTSGIVHIESAVVKPFYLGQFFTEWGVQMGGGCVAGQCAPAHPVSVYVNGQPVTTPAEKVELTAHAEIVVAIGQAPATIPSSYSFPSGY